MLINLDRFLIRMQYYDFTVTITNKILIKYD